MGFPRESAVNALVQNGNDLQLAANWLVTTSKHKQTSRSSPRSSESTVFDSNTVPVLAPTPGVGQQTPSLTKPVVPGSHHETQGLVRGSSGNRMTFSSPSSAAGMGGGGGGTDGALENFLYLKQQPQQQPVTESNPTAVAEHKTRASRLKESRAKYSSLFGNDG